MTNLPAGLSLPTQSILWGNFMERGEPKYFHFQLVCNRMIYLCVKDIGMVLSCLFACTFRSLVSTLCISWLSLCSHSSVCRAAIKCCSYKARSSQLVQKTLLLVNESLGVGIYEEEASGKWEHICTSQLKITSSGEERVLSPWSTKLMSIWKPSTWQSWRWSYLVGRVSIPL